MEASVPCRHLPQLAETLWAERHLVEDLVFKLVSHRLVLEGDHRRFVSRTLDEVEQVVDQLWQADRARRAALHAVATEWRRQPEAVTLADLAREAPEPWGSMFAEHRAAFARMSREIARTTSRNRRLARAALGEIGSALATLRAGAPGDTSRIPGPGARAEHATVALPAPGVAGSLTLVTTGAERVSRDPRRPEDAEHDERILELRLQQVALRATADALGRPLPPALAAFVR